VVNHRQIVKLVLGKYKRVANLSSQLPPFASPKEAAGAKNEFLIFDVCLKH
jgi:hypothetical protein